MGFWRKNIKEFEGMMDLLTREPGLNSNQVAVKMGICPSTITRRLASMNDAGILLYEDSRGGLYLFNPHE